MSSGEGPIGTAKGKQANTIAPYHPPPPTLRVAVPHVVCGSGPLRRRGMRGDVPGAPGMDQRGGLRPRRQHGRGRGRGLHRADVEPRHRCVPCLGTGPSAGAGPGHDAVWGGSGRQRSAENGAERQFEGRLATPRQNSLGGLMVGPPLFFALVGHHQQSLLWFIIWGHTV